MFLKKRSEPRDYISNTNREDFNRENSLLQLNKNTLILMKTRDFIVNCMQVVYPNYF